VALWTHVQQHKKILEGLDAEERQRADQRRRVSLLVLGVISSVLFIVFFNVLN
jgi:hypothetical protein